MSTDGGAASADSSGGGGRSYAAAVGELLETAATLAGQRARSELTARAQAEHSVMSRWGVTIVACGECSRGKSLFCNALIRWPDLLPVDIDVATGVYVVVEAADEPSATVMLRDRQAPLQIAAGDMADWVSVGANPDNVKGVEYVHARVPSAFLQRGITIIDTPGCNGLTSAHGEMTLTAISQADALLFVLDASAPLSRPELTFLQRASERIDRVLFVLTKIDKYPNWISVVDENRQLLARYAPRFADNRIFPVSSRTEIRGLEKARGGQQEDAKRLLQRSGVQLVRNVIRTEILAKAQAIRMTNALRLVSHIAGELQAAIAAELAAIGGDTSVVAELRQTREDLKQLQRGSEGWRMQLGDSLHALQRQLNRFLQDSVTAIQQRFEEQIAIDWQPGDHASISADIAGELHKLAADVQDRCAEGMRQSLAESAERLRLNEVPLEDVRLDVPDRPAVAARNVAPSASLKAVMLSQSVLPTVLNSIFNPFMAVLAPLGLTSFLVNMSKQRRIAEQQEARRIVMQSCTTFSRDCMGAIDDLTVSSRGQIFEAVQAALTTRLADVNTQIKVLEEAASEASDREKQREKLAQEETVIRRLAARAQHLLQGLGAAADERPAAARRQDSTAR